MKFITTAPDRRTLVKAIAAHTGMEPSYIGPLTFNYTVGTITIDREGYVDVPDEQAADLKAFLIAKGWMEPEPEPEQPRIQIGVPAKDLTVANVTNLIYMLYSKQYLLGKAVGTACPHRGHGHYPAAGIHAGKPRSLRRAAAGFRSAGRP